jgi:hypothetical protein
MVEASAGSQKLGVSDRGRRSGAGLTARLITLVMLPVSTMCGLAGSVIFSRLSSATQAGAVDHGAIGLSALVALGDSLHVQQSVEAFDARFVQVGVSRAVATNFIGFDCIAAGLYSSTITQNIV